MAEAGPRGGAAGARCDDLVGLLFHNLENENKHKGTLKLDNSIIPSPSLMSFMCFRALSSSRLLLALPDN